MYRSCVCIPASERLRFDVDPQGLDVRMRSADLDVVKEILGRANRLSATLKQRGQCHGEFFRLRKCCVCTAKSCAVAVPFRPRKRAQGRDETGRDGADRMTATDEHLRGNIASRRRTSVYVMQPREGSSPPPRTPGSRKADDRVGLFCFALLGRAARPPHLPGHRAAPCGSASVFDMMGHVPSDQTS